MLCVIDGILDTSIITIYWFFPALFSVYLCIPLISAVSKEKRKEVFSMFAVVGFIINLLIPFIINIFEINVSWDISVYVISGYLIYAIVGYLVSHYEMSKSMTKLIYVFSILGLLMHIVGTYLFSVIAGEIDTTYKGYLNVPCILYSVGVFLFVKNNGNKIMNGKMEKIITFIGKYTLGIYLIHQYVMDFVRIHIFNEMLGISYLSIIYRLGSPLIIIIISIMAIYIMRKIPVLKYIVP